MMWGRLVHLWLRIIFRKRKKVVIVAHNPAFDPSFAYLQDYARADVLATQQMHDILYNPVRK